MFSRPIIIKHCLIHFIHIQWLQLVSNDILTVRIASATDNQEHDMHGITIFQQLKLSHVEIKSFE